MKVNNILKFKQSKGNKSSKNKDIMTRLHVHNHTLVIYTQYKFISEITSIAYLVMAKDGKIIEI